MITRTPHSEPESLELGATFAGYRISVPIGEDGGAGTVYAATALAPEQLPESPPWLPLALKVFSTPSSWDAAMERGFVETARLQSTIHHPNLVSIYEVGTSPTPFLSMTLVRGLNLAELIASTRLDDTAALEVTRCVTGALEAAHEHGLVYRGLKPSGVLLPAGEARRAMLGDFGAGRSAEIDSDVESNVRALGAILFECLTCKPVSSTSGKLREFRPDLPAALEAVLAGALDEDGSRRHASPGDFLAAVEQVFPHRRRQLRAPAQRAPRMEAPAKPQPAPWMTREAVAETVPAAAPAETAAPAVAAAAAPVAAAAPATAPTRRTRRAKAAPAVAAAAAAPAAAAPAAAPAKAAAPAREATGAKPPAERRAPLAGAFARIPRTALILSLVLVAAVLLGVALAPHDGSTRAATVTSRSLALTLPDSWSRTDKVAAIPGLKLSDAVGAKPPGQDGARSALVAGRLSGGNPRALPTALAERLQQQPRRDAVELGSLQAYRFSPVRPAGAGKVATVYMVPTSAGGVAVACVAPESSGGFMLDCERIVSTLRLKGATPESVGASPDYLRALRKPLARLDRSRSSAARDLRTAQTRGGQGAAAGRLSDAYGTAARALGKVAPPAAARELQTGTVRSLTTVSRGYARMSRAAGAGPGRGVWNAGRRQVVRGERSLQGNLQQLGALGYSVSP